MKIFKDKIMNNDEYRKMKNLKKLQLRSRKKKNKKGGMESIILLLIGTFILTVMLGLLVYIWMTVDTAMNNIPSSDVTLDISGAVNDTFGQTTPHVASSLHWWGYMFIFAAMIAMLVSAASTRIHPAFFFLYVFIIIACFIAAVGLSNYYTILLSDPALGDTFKGFLGNYFIMKNLPIIILVMGFLFSILAFTGMAQRQEFMGGGV